MKAVWDYVKEHNLQDPDDKRYFLCDEKLEAVFHVKRLHGLRVCPGVDHLEVHDQVSR